MNQEIKAQWVAALRSGEYKKTAGALHRVEGIKGFCCLGVLCEIAVKAGKAVRSVVPTNDGTVAYYSPDNRNDASSGLLPRCVAEWAELPDDDLALDHLGGGPTCPVVEYRGMAIALTQLNDSEGLDFPQIANLIEESL